MSDAAGTRPQPRWDLVALTVRYRRGQLGYDVEPLAAHVGVTPEAWRTLEAGRRPSGFHKEHAAAVSVALGWTPDSLDRIVRGHRPLDAPGAAPTVGRASVAAPHPSAPASAPAKAAPAILAPICTTGPDGVRQVDPARLGVLGGLVILAAVVVVWFRR